MGCDVEQVESGVLCSGECSSRSACPTGTCRGPSQARTRSHTPSYLLHRFKIFRRLSTGSSQDLARQRRRSSSAGPKERQGAAAIRERRQNVCSWPIATSSPAAAVERVEARRSWRRWLPWSQNKERQEAGDRRGSGSVRVPVARGALVEGEGGRVHIVCSNCAEQGDATPLHRGINISSSSIGSEEGARSPRSARRCQSARREEGKRTGKLASLARLFSLPGTPERRGK